MIFEQDRWWQRELAEAVASSDGRSVRGFIAPALGKTLSGYLAALYLLVAGAIDSVIWLVPRYNLAHQVADKYHVSKKRATILGLKCENHGYGKCPIHEDPWFYRLEAPRESRHWVVGNNGKPPLLKSDEFGLVMTYQSLISPLANDLLFKPGVGIARSRRFLLVADETQFLSDLESKNVTLATRMVDKLVQASAASVFMTGAQGRNDGELIHGFPFIKEYVKKKKREEYFLDRAQLDVWANYGDGIEQQAVRKHVFEFMEGDLRLQEGEGLAAGKPEDMLASDLTRYDGKLTGALREEIVWAEGVDRVMAALRIKKMIDPRFKAVISCIDQAHARTIFRWIKKQARYNGLDVRIAISDPVVTEVGAPETLDDFRIGNGDVLITVRMAFIGFDQPWVIVVGILTNIRDIDHLSQLVHRGSRVVPEVPWEGQYLHIVAPPDPLMKTFEKYLNEEMRRGISLLEGHGGGGGPGVKRRDWHVIDARNWRTQFSSMGEIFSGDEREHEFLRKMCEQFGQSPEAIRRMMAENGFDGFRSTSNGDSSSHSGAKDGFTEREQEALLRDSIKKHLGRLINLRHPGCRNEERSRWFSHYYANLNKIQDVESQSEMSLHDLEARLRIIEKWEREAGERGETEFKFAEEA